LFCLAAHVIYAHANLDAMYGPEDRVIIPKEIIIETAAQLAKFLKYEFILHPVKLLSSRSFKSECLRFLSSLA
jgi:hypothetical protein